MTLDRSDAQPAREAAGVNLSDLLYAIEGELPEDVAMPPRPDDRPLEVVFTTDDRQEFEFAGAACDGELLIINLRATAPGV
jgi:hypothetical protein